MVEGAPADLGRLSLNTATIKGASLVETVRVAERAGLRWIAPWRDRVAEVGLDQAVRLFADAGLSVSSLCRGGFLTAADPQAQRRSLAENREAIREAAVLGAGDLVMVVGGLPTGDRDLAAARARVADRIADLVPTAVEHGVRLLLEALHPMYCADRAVLSTLGQALDLAADFPVEAVGVVVDTFHVWWDPDLPAQIALAGSQGRLGGYQICDFLMPIAADPLLSRGMMGDGVIDFASITRVVARTGYPGPVEVEIFNADVWAAEPAAVLATMIERYRELVLPLLGPDRTDGRGT